MSEITEPADNTAPYNHEELTDQLDALNRQMSEMKETILNTSVRAHLLEAELATLYNPEVAEALRKVKEECASCSQVVSGGQI